MDKQAQMQDFIKNLEELKRLTTSPKAIRDLDEAISQAKDMADLKKWGLTPGIRRSGP